MNYLNASGTQTPGLGAAYKLTRFLYYLFLVCVVGYLVYYGYQRANYARFDGLIDIKTISVTAPVSGIVEDVYAVSASEIPSDEKLFTISYVKTPTAATVNEKLRVEKNLSSMAAKRTSLQKRIKRKKLELSALEKSAMFEVRLNLEDKISFRTDDINLLKADLFNLNKAIEAEQVHLAQLGGIISQEGEQPLIDVAASEGGIVKKVNVEKGQFVHAGSDLLTLIPSNATIWIDALVPLDTFTHLKSGSTATVTLNENIKFKARLTQVNPENSQFKASISDVSTYVVIRLAPETEEFSNALKQASNFSVNIVFEI